VIAYSLPHNLAVHLQVVGAYSENDRVCAARVAECLYDLCSLSPALRLHRSITDNNLGSVEFAFVGKFCVDAVPSVR
jgi:hypothetical protein